MENKSRMNACINILSNVCPMDCENCKLFKPHDIFLSYQSYLEACERYNFIPNSYEDWVKMRREIGL